MNKRIQVLAASYFPRDEEGNIHVTPEIIGEFAELIVKECMTVARKADGLDAEYEAWYLIKQHFGVEE